MLEKTPTSDELTTLVGENLYDIWKQLCMKIDEIYDMDCLWSDGGKKWTYEYKWRRGGKNLCALYAKENCIGFMIILGRNERDKFETMKDDFSQEIQNIYDDSKTFHDGKWIMFELKDTVMFDEFIQLLAIKRKPNRKTND